jgi:DNA-binding SARP family transcriptional activator
MRVWRAGRPVGNLAYDKVRALLAYLALERHQLHDRDDLAALLWPDVADDLARHSLRSAVCTLRRALADEADESDQGRVILATRNSLQLNPELTVTLDTVQFQGLVARAVCHAHPAGELCRECSAALETAVSMYRGDFMCRLSIRDSVAFENWSLTQREQLHLLALGALQRLATYWERQQNDTLARRYAMRQLELEPWSEEAYRCLMRVFSRSGRRHEAIAQFEQCRRVLQRELGLEPADETCELYAAIRAGAPQRELRLGSQLA